MADNEAESQISFDLQPPSSKDQTSAPNKRERQYDVGYGRPPQHSRFKPGQSGNPKGKPKGAKNLATIVNDAINEKVVVTENGKRRKASKLEVAIKQIVNKAATGDPKATAQLLPLVQMIDTRAEAVAKATPSETNDADQTTMTSIIERLRRNTTAETPSTNPEEKEPKK